MSQTSRTSPSVPWVQNHLLCRTGHPVHPHKALGLAHLQGTWRSSPSAPGRSDARPGCEADARPGLCLLRAACAGATLDAAAPCPVVNDLRWDLSAQQIGELTAELMEQTKRVYDRVGSQRLEDVSYESTLKALADVEVSYTGKTWPGPGQGALGP